MNDMTVHARKKRKNLAVLLAVLGWCALIFFISMARMAHGAENKDVPTPAFAMSRAAHQKIIDSAAQSYKDSGTTWRDTLKDRPAGWFKEYPPKSPPP